MFIHDEAAINSKGNFVLQITNASLIVHKLELNNDTFVSFERALSKKAAQYDFREVFSTTYLVGDGINLFYKDDIFSRAPISKIIKALVPEKNFSGSFDTNTFHFQQHGLDSVRLNREGSLVGGTQLTLGDGLIRAYFSDVTCLQAWW